MRMLKYNKVISTLIITFVVVLIIGTSFLASAQNPSVEANIQVVQDGISPFDSLTFAPPTTNPGKDANDTNGVVRVSDKMVYQVDINLNDADQTNLLATVTLDKDDAVQKQQFITIPGICKTPNSLISTDKRTLTCDLGAAKQGTNFRFKVEASVLPTAKSLDIVSATVVGSTSSITSNPFKSKDTIVTADFRINLVKSHLVPKPRIEDWVPKGDIKDPNGVNGAVFEYKLSAVAQIGSEMIKADADGFKDFVLSDVMVVNNPAPNTPSNAKLYTWGSPNEGPCVKIGTAISSITCAENSKGNFTINLDNVDVSYPDKNSNVFAIAFRVWIPYTDALLPAGNYNANILNTVDGLDAANIKSVTGLVNYENNIEPKADNFLDSNYTIVPQGTFDFTKDINREVYGGVKPGEYKVVQGEEYFVTLGFGIDNKSKGYNNVCDSIDTSKVEFTRPAPEYTILRTTSITAKVYAGLTGLQAPGYDYAPKYNPGRVGLNFDNSQVQIDGSKISAKVEYSTKPVTDLVSTNCRDDFDGDGSYDWLPAVPSDPSTVTRVRFTWDRDPNEITAMYPNLQYEWDKQALHFTFGLKPKMTTPVGTVIGNFATATDFNKFEYTPGYFGEKVTPGEPGYSVGHSSDSVKVIGASFGILKQNTKINEYVVDAGQIVEYSIKPTVNGKWPVGQSPEFVLEDTLDPDMELDKASISVVNPNGTMSAPEINGDLIKWTLTNPDLTKELPTIKYKVKVKKSVIAKILKNTVSITSNNDEANKASDSLCQASCTVPDKPKSTVAIEVKPTNKYQVYKEKESDLYELNKDFVFNLKYKNSSGIDYQKGDYIDILPYNGDDKDETLRERDNIGGVGGSKFNGSLGLKELPVGSNGEIFSYTTDLPSSIPIDTCDSRNHPIDYVPVLGDNCYTRYILYGNQFADGQSKGTGTIVWTSTPSDLSKVTAIRWTADVHNAGSPDRNIKLTLLPKDNLKDDVYCNNFSGHVSENTLLIISNDVCVKTISSSLSGKVWLDLNNSGTSQPDPSETMLKDIEVGLYLEDGTPVLDSLGKPRKTLTDTNGEYVFDNLNSGTYITKVLNQPAKTNQTYDTDDIGKPTLFTTPNTSGKATISPVLNPTTNQLESLTVATQINYSYYDPSIYGTIGDYIWKDTNADGIKDPSEMPIADITVVLKDKDGNVIATTKTDINGKYLFEKVVIDQLNPTEFIVVVTPPDSLIQSYDKDGLTTLNQSKVTLTPTLIGSINLDQDFGYFDKPKVIVPVEIINTPRTGGQNSYIIITLTLIIGMLLMLYRLTFSS
jgi:SdrD B-like domain